MATVGHDHRGHLDRVTARVHCQAEQHHHRMNGVERKQLTLVLGGHPYGHVFLESLDSVAQLGEKADGTAAYLPWLCEGGSAGDRKRVVGVSQLNGFVIKQYEATAYDRSFSGLEAKGFGHVGWWLDLCYFSELVRTALPVASGFLAPSIAGRPRADVVGGDAGPSVRGGHDNTPFQTLGVHCNLIEYLVRLASPIPSLTWVTKESWNAEP
jgi:hypothetical protein